MCTLDPLLENLGVVIDNFMIPGRFHFLTHVHSDHMSGLSKNFTLQIYCTEISRDLLMIQKPIDKSRFVILNENKRFLLDETLFVTPIQANHCDGSIMLLFEVDELRILYTGDFRYDREWRFFPMLHFPISKLYFDDTLSNFYQVPNYSETVISMKEAIFELREIYGFGIQIFINSSILGIEMILRKLSRDLREGFSISASLDDSFRGLQIRYLLGDVIVDTPTTLTLGHRQKDDLDNHQWIIPTSTHFLCLNKKPDFKLIPDNHRYIWFSTHADKREIEKLQHLCQPKEAIGCKYTFENLQCLKKK